VLDGEGDGERLFGVGSVSDAGGGGVGGGVDGGGGTPVRLVV
jgi:hypothetical protein